MAAYVSLTEQRRLTVVLPSIAEQQAIPGLLGTLDDKIESNRRLAVTVDELVRGEVTAASAGGTEVRLVDLAALVRQTAQPDEIEPTARYIGLEHMPRRSKILDHWRPPAGLGSAKSRFQPGDILFGKLRPYFGKVGLAPRTGGVCSTDILVLRPQAPELAAFTLAVLASDELIDFASNAASGTRMPRASWEHMSTYPVLVPPDDVLADLAATLDPLLEAAQRGIEENVILAEFRDTLLPELLSGRIRFACRPPRKCSPRRRDVLRPAGGKPS